MIKRILKNSYFVRIMGQRVKLLKKRIQSNGLFNQILRKGVNISGSGCYKFQKDVVGRNNTIQIGTGAFINDAVIYIRGNNNSLVIGKDVIIGKGCSFWMEGNNCKIIIKSSTTMTCNNHLNCQEDNTFITIGEDCMLSNNIIIRTSDSHPIIDCDTNTRINNARSITIGNHVWIAPNSKIMKGSEIGEGSIIGSDTTVTKKFPSNSLIVGRPAKIVKSNVKWTRDKLF